MQNLNFKDKDNLTTAETEAPQGEQVGVPEQATETSTSEVGSESQQATDQAAAESDVPKKRLAVKTIKDPTEFKKTDELTEEIEKILEEGISEEFSKMSPIAQQEFKIKGEETAQGIREMLRKTKIKVKKVVKMILEWLRMLPGVNRFYLEQEAKIKADRIIHLQDEE